MQVIKGAASLLVNYSPELFIEMHPQYLMNQTELIEQIQSYGYEVFVVDHRDSKAESVEIDQATLPTKREWLLHAIYQKQQAPKRNASVGPGG